MELKQGSIRTKTQSHQERGKQRSFLKRKREEKEKRRRKEKDVVRHIPPTGIGRTRVSAAFNKPAHIARKRIVSSNGLEKRLRSFFKIADGCFDKVESNVGGHLDVSVFVEQERNQGVNLSVFLCVRRDEGLAGHANRLHRP